MFPIDADQYNAQEEYWTIAPYKTFQQYSWDVGCDSLSEVMKWHLNQVEVRTLAGLLQKVYSLLLKPFC